MIHLGLGNFFRAHQAWYTARASDAAEWRIAAFAGRGSDLATRLDAQGGLYTLITRGSTDEFEIVSAISRAHRATDHAAWQSYLAKPTVGVVSLTVTEAGYTRNADGGLDHSDPAVRADLATLRTEVNAPGATAVARLVAGLAARAAAAAGPIAVVPCDNLPGNGAALKRIVLEFAEYVTPDLATWIESNVSFVTSVVDRITPAGGGEESLLAESVTGYHDSAPVVTEPYHEWVLCGEFPAGRPRWETAGAVFTRDIAAYEQRKLWMLNGAHSLLAYTAPLRGHRTVAAAVADPVCRAWVDQWWSEVTPHIDLPAGEVHRYRTELIGRFANHRIQHHLSQIAVDGAQKLPVRILPVLRRERAAGRLPAGAVRALAGWACDVGARGAGLSDIRAPGRPEVRSALLRLDPALGVDSELMAAVVREAERLCGRV
ncbi:mannitol dehydrogenase family protein [Nocardia sp. CA-290969]|uniref:mannitol dehydrogenase family protein n=1 Tax=Nocardia sp. CA-290969 TaxID=3239986 RepID=UPI003D8AD867